MHELNTREDAFSGLERFESEHRSDDSLDGAVVWFDDIVEVFRLSNDKGQRCIFDDLIDGRFIGTTFIHRHFLGDMVIAHSLVEEAHRSSFITLGGQQEIDRVAGLIDGAIQIFPGALN